MRWLAALLLAAAAPLAGAEVRATLCGVGVPGQRLAGLDADRDGVPDSDDWCAGTQAGTPVGSNGCADWEVPARCERKPAPVAPPAEVAPDDSADRANGLAVDRFVLQGTAFALGSATLLPESHEALRAVAAALRASPRMRVQIGGHTDSVGPAAGNRRLSQRRAEAVKRFLAGEGVDAARLSAVGFGEARPVDDNQTAAGRANNRRVEFRVTGGG